MSNFLTNAVKSLQEYHNEKESLKQSISPEYVKAVSLATKYYNAAKSVNIDIGNRETAIRQEASRIFDGGADARIKTERAIKFLETQATYINSYNAADEQRDKEMNAYFEDRKKAIDFYYKNDQNKLKKLDELTKEGFHSIDDDQLKQKGALADSALFNIKSYQESIDPNMVVDSWTKWHGVRDFVNHLPGKDNIRAVDKDGRIIKLNDDDRYAKEKINTKPDFSKDILDIKEKSIMNAPLTPQSVEIKKSFKKYKDAGYSMQALNGNVLIVANDRAVISDTYVGGVNYTLLTDKATGIQTLITQDNISGESSNKVVNEINQNVVDNIFGKVKTDIEKATSSEIASTATADVSKAEEIEKEIDDKIVKETAAQKQNDPVGTVKEFDDGTYTYVNKDGSIHVGKQGDGYEDTTTPKSYSGGGSALYGSPVASQPKQIYRIKAADGKPDMLFDASTNKQIANNEEFLANYKGATEIEVPDSVKLIYREGEKIFDAKTNKQILNTEELANYKGAVETKKEKSDEDYYNEMKAEIGGARADDQPEYSDEQIKSMALAYKQGNYNSAAEAFSKVSKQYAKQDIENVDGPDYQATKRKFSRIVKDENGNIKVDDDGRPVSEDFYLGVYTKEELDGYSDEQKAEIVESMKKEFMKDGGTEEEWQSSDSKLAIEDIVTNPASDDELQRKTDLDARKTLMPDKIKKEAEKRLKLEHGEAWDKMTPEEQAKKLEAEQTKLDLEYKNAQGKTGDNVSEDVNIGIEEKKESILPGEGENPTDPTEGTTEEATTTTTNPWQLNSVKFVEPKKDGLMDKRMSYRKQTYKETLGGTE